MIVKTVASTKAVIVFFLPLQSVRIREARKERQTTKKRKNVFSTRETLKH